MELLTLYQFAEKYGVVIDEFPMKDIVSVSFPQGWIAINKEKLPDTAEEKTCIAHEMGHIETGSFYNIYSPCDIRQRHENRADKWAIRRMISEDDLDNAIAEGYTELWELAEHFNVTEDFMRKVICWYTYGNLNTELCF